ARIALFLLCVFFVSSSPAGGETTSVFPGQKVGQVRGLFVTADGDPGIYSSRSDIHRLIDFADKSRVKIIFVQVYKANLAWFPSNVGDPFPGKAALKAVGEDPVALLIKEAHRKGIEVHGWLNILSLGANQNATLLKKYGPGILTRNTKKKTAIEDYKIDKQYFLEPGDPRVHKELSDLIGEVLQAYPAIDGLQFDYIRYPDTDPHYGYTEINAERFKKASGIVEIDDASEEWRDWKRDQVTDLLKELILKARVIRPGIRVSATGCMPYSRALYEAFQDWPMWIDEGIVDFVTVMNYSTDTEEYGRWITQIKAKVKDFSKVYIAIGAYKRGTNREIFRNECNTCETSGAGSCVVFYYSSLLQKPDLCRFMIDDEGG
ncbi:MAG: family 10 glycosylhydrolase, partial [Candidatus Omnitrophota bacterium]